MTQWRDARLTGALDHAPDAHMVPDGRTRAAILNAARQTIGQTVTSTPGWWQRLNAALAARRPWNAAFATVLVASVITLLWRHEEVPDAQVADAPIAASPRPEKSGP